MSPRSSGVEITRHDARSAGTASDTVAVEDPLEIRLGDVPLAVVMRTPGDDDDLVRGFFLTEGILLEPAEIRAIDRIDESPLLVRLADGIDVDASQFQRNMFASSSCGPLSAGPSRSALPPPSLTACGSISRLSMPPVGFTPQVCSTWEGA